MLGALISDLSSAYAGQICIAVTLAKELQKEADGGSVPCNYWLVSLDLCVRGRCGVGLSPPPYLVLYPTPSYNLVRAIERRRTRG